MAINITENHFIITPEYRRENQKHLSGRIIVSDIHVMAKNTAIPVKIIQYTQGDRAGEYDLIFQDYRYSQTRPYSVIGKHNPRVFMDDRCKIEGCGASMELSQVNRTFQCPECGYTTHDAGDDGRRLCRMDPHYLAMDKTSPKYEYLIIRSLDDEYYNLFIKNHVKGWVAIDRIVHFWTFWSRLRTFMWGSHGVMDGS